MEVPLRGKEKVLALGLYPEVSLANARDARDDARRLLRGRVDPGEQKKAAATAAVVDAASGFEAIAREWLATLVFVRPGELRQAEWAEMDLDADLWSIPAARMKMRQPHIVPLARQAVEILRELKPYTEAGKHVFPARGKKDRPMSEVAVLAALRAMGFDKDTVMGHGFRATARTLLDEVLGFRPDIIEHQLAHAVRDLNGRAYNRTPHLEERVRMMQEWADYLDRLRDGNVAQLRVA
jgi:integrase